MSTDGTWDFELSCDKSTVHLRHLWNSERVGYRCPGVTPQRQTVMDTNALDRVQRFVEACDGETTGVTVIGDGQTYSLAIDDLRDVVHMASEAIR